MKPHSPVPVITTPACEPGAGDVIFSPDSPCLIDGVVIESQGNGAPTLGWFQKFVSFGRDLERDFPAASTRASAAVSLPGITQGFRYYLYETDFWAAARGQIQVALVDLRPGSPTFGRKNTVYIGDHCPWRILIPPGVGHAYKVVGRSPAVLVYSTDRFSPPADMGQIAPDDPSIAYEWAA